MENVLLPPKVCAHARKYPLRGGGRRSGTRCIPGREELRGSPPRSRNYYRDAEAKGYRIDRGESNTVYAFILGFNHNSSVEGGNSIHFQFGKTAAGVDIAFVNSYGSTGTGFCMNTSNTNSGGWNNSYMRKTICPAFLAALPTAWQNIIAACTKYSDNTGGGSNTASYVTATSDKIWLLSEMEVQGTRSYANSAEANYQKQYDYYRNGNSKVKYQHTATTSACRWWLRSVYASTAYDFCGVNADGSANYYNAYFSFGFAPGFKVA